jgi:micrococcal nuclease
MSARVRRSPGLGAIALLAVAVVLVVRGCDEGGDGSGAGDGRQPGERVRAEVVRIVDGDTIEVVIEGSEEDVRYIGVDTPESVAPGEPVECFGPEASEFNERLVAGETVTLAFDRELRDAYGRLLAYVFADGVLVNAELVARGFARTLEIAPNTSKAQRLARLERRAGAAARGLWGACEG